MVDERTASPVHRPLLVNGEALSLDVQAPSPGGGEKYEPQTVDQARAALLPQVAGAVDAAARLPQEQ